MRLHVVSALFATAIGVGAAITACQLVFPLTAKDDVDAASPVARTDASGPDGGDGCTLAHPPPPPAAGPPGDIDFFFAAKDVNFGQDAGPTVGYDLDGVCTTDLASESCTPPLVLDQAHVDGPQGRDVSGNNFLGDLVETYLQTTDYGDIPQRIALGRLGYVIQLKHYNGTANSLNVEVGVYDSAGLFDFGGDAGARRYHPPAWDGKDEWNIDCGLSSANCPIPDGSAPLKIDNTPISSGYFDPQAYVTDNTLVARLASVNLNFAVTVLRVSDVVVTATIGHVDGGYSLVGQVAGRISVSDVFAAYNDISYDLGGATGFRCQDPEFNNEAFRVNVCRSLDLALTKPPDGKKATCDALSVALPFTAYPAKVGYRVDEPQIQGCDGGIADCTSP